MDELHSEGEATKQHNVKSVTFGAMGPKQLNSCVSVCITTISADNTFWVWSLASVYSTHQNSSLVKSNCMCRISIVLMSLQNVWLLLWYVHKCVVWGHFPLQPQSEWCDLQWSHCSGQSSPTKKVTGRTEVSCKISDVQKSTQHVIYTCGHYKMDPSMLQLQNYSFSKCSQSCRFAGILSS